MTVTFGVEGRVFVADEFFDSECQTLVNAVNCVGVMGAGIALEFKKRYPEMYADYRSRCEHENVRVGHPYLWRGIERNILNFPTKVHWTEQSSIAGIEQGLEYFMHNYEHWGVTSAAFPALGCGCGGRDWPEVRGVMIRHLSSCKIPVHVYPPMG